MFDCNGNSLSVDECNKILKYIIYKKSQITLPLKIKFRFNGFLVYEDDIRNVRKYRTASISVHPIYTVYEIRFLEPIPFDVNCMTINEISIVNMDNDLLVSWDDAATSSDENDENDEIDETSLSF